MHPTVMAILADERTADLRANAAYHRRARFALARTRRRVAQARRARAARVAHA
jgi:ribosomal protein S12 methylthiotransferase accessory factor YcaO